jgi:5-methylcytosine-specific restriction protein B
MNLADRSLALVDLALRRRFAFINLVPALGSAWSKWCVDHGVPQRLIDAIAERLSDLNKVIGDDRALGPQFRVGHSFVTPVSKNTAPADWFVWYNEVVETEIGPLLAEYWYDNQSRAQTEIAKLSIGEGE